jgi:5-formyltetrahydrofolate cyclo-ligase
MTDKAQLRRELKARLARIRPEDRVEKSRRICGYVLQSQPYQSAAGVMLFLSMPHEVDTTPLILAAWQDGKTVVVPKVSWEQRHIIPVEINSLETGLEKDKMGLRTPISGVPVPYEEIDLIIVPGLGFDRQGNRLGRGGSYYDRFFAAHAIKAPKWGVCFSEQICPEIPHNERDVPMDAIVCEEGIIHCSPAMPPCINKKYEV